MLPIGQVEPGMVGLFVGPCPRIHRWRPVIVVARVALGPRSVMGVGVQDNVVEAVGGQLVEELVHGRQFGVGRIQRPQPVTFVTYREEAGAILADEMARMLRINSHTTMHPRRTRSEEHTSEL